MLSRVHLQVRLVPSPYSAQDPRIECASLSACIYQRDDPRHRDPTIEYTVVVLSSAIHPLLGRSIQYFPMRSKTSLGSVFNLKRRHCTASIYYRVFTAMRNRSMEKSFSSSTFRRSSNFRLLAPALIVRIH